MPTEKLTVAHYASSYLPITENWIHKLLTNFKSFAPIFLTRKKRNIELFPLSMVISLSDFSDVGKFAQLILFRVIGYFPFFKKACLEHRAKLIHVHFGYHGIKMLGLKRTLKIPLVCSFYGDDAFADIFTSNQKYEGLFQEANRILVLGSYMKARLIRLGCDESKIYVHHLGIDLDSIQFLKRNVQKNEPIRFLIASSFLEKKGVDIALQALSTLALHFDFRVDVIGDGPLRPNIESIVYGNNLGERIVLYGYRPYDFFIDLAYHCHVFIQASKTTPDNRKEGTPMAIADVMATGMPVIATRHSDIPELVKDNVTGYLADENDVDSLIEVLRKLLSNPDRIAGMGMEARMHIEREFNVKIQGERLEQHYFDLLKA